MLKRFGTLGASIWLIFLGVVALAEVVLTIIARHPVERSQDLTILIACVVFGLIYYLTFRLLGGWRVSTWDSPDSGRKTLLFLIGLPGLLVGSIVLIFVIWFWLTDTTNTSNYHLAKKPKKQDIPAEVSTGEVPQAGEGA